MASTMGSPSAAWIQRSNMGKIHNMLFRITIPFLFCVVSVAGNGMHNEGQQSSNIAGISKKCQGDDDLGITTKILETISQWKEEIQHNRRPFVTLTFAQTVDGKIALYTSSNSKNNQTSSNFPLSGPESLVMTHGLRTIHDAILVGGRTLSTDNPRLSNRLWKASQHQPRPVVLDTHLHHVRIVQSVRAKNLIVCCSDSAAKAYRQGEYRLPPSFHLLPCPLVGGRLDISYILSQLRHEYGIESLMVEGGSQVLSMFMEQQLVDCVCVTIAPKLFGGNGLSAYSCCWSVGKPSHPIHVELDESRFFPLDNDCILLGKWRSV